jgi:hypothetical protein
MPAPETVTVAVTRADGGVSVLKVIKTEYDGERVRARYNVTPEYVDSIIAKYGWTGDLAPVSWRFVGDDYGAADRTYRNAWKDNGGGKPGHDMPKAREIHRQHLRKARLREMDALDIDYQRADEMNDQARKRAVATRKQALRDVTADPRIEQAQTVDELAALTLETLAGPVA